MKKKFRIFYRDGNLPPLFPISLEEETRSLELEIIESILEKGTLFVSGTDIYFPPLILDYGVRKADKKFWNEYQRNRGADYSLRPHMSEEEFQNSFPRYGLPEPNRTIFYED